MQYPSNDDQYQDQNIDSVSREKDGTYTIKCDGWSLWCGNESAVVPEAGQTARMYGKGIGFSVRGLFINGLKVWYRSDADAKEYCEIQSYGADAADWLRKWDAGDCCWTIEMGGLGPGYEQCIHITCAEILRWFLAHEVDASKWSEAEAWKSDREKMTADLYKVRAVEELGLSGAQWGAAVNLATRFYLDGPRKVMTDGRVQDRRIQVSKNFPGSKAA